MSDQEKVSQKPVKYNKKVKTTKLKDKIVQKKYINPIIIENAPDPEVLIDEDGSIHVFTTQGEVNGIWHSIQHFISHDGVSYKRLPDALKDHSKWSEGQNTWAPAVVKVANKYVMYFCGKTKAGGHAIGVAVSSSLHDPFISLPEPLIYGDSTYGDIDPHLDVETMELFWGSARLPIRKIKLTEDGLAKKYPKQQPDYILHPVPGLPYENLQEAPELLSVINTETGKRNKVLITSGHDSFGKDETGQYGKSYALMAYYFNEQTQKFENISILTGKPSNIILGDNTNERIVNPGHHRTLIDAKGQYFVYYHAIDLNDKTSVNPVTGEPPRKLFMDQMFFKSVKGFMIPYFQGDMPSRTKKLGPALKRS